MTDFTNINEIPEWAKQMACDKANARADCVLWVPSEVGRGLGLHQPSNLPAQREVGLILR